MRVTDSRPSPPIPVSTSTPSRVTVFSVVPLLAVPALSWLLMVTAPAPPPLMVTSVSALPVTPSVPAAAAPLVTLTALPPVMVELLVVAVVRLTSVVPAAVMVAAAVSEEVALKLVRPAIPETSKPSNLPLVVTLMFSTFLIVAPPKVKAVPATVAESATFRVSVPAAPSMTSRPPKGWSAAALQEALMVSLPEVPTMLSIPLVSSVLCLD